MCSGDSRAAFIAANANRKPHVQGLPQDLEREARGEGKYLGAKVDLEGPAIELEGVIKVELIEKAHGFIEVTNGLIQFIPGVGDFGRCVIVGGHYTITGVLAGQAGVSAPIF